MSDLVNTALKDLGAAGAAISVLMTAVTVLSGVVAVLWKRGNSSSDSTNKARFAEREILIKLVEANNTALNRNSEATEQRNEVTQELADAIKAQGTSFEMVNQRVGYFHDDNKEKLKDLRDVVSSMADAVRVNTGVLTDVRNGVTQVQNTMQRRRT